MTMEISNLPVEVLEYIFIYLSSPADQQRLCLVCWLWKDIVDRMRTLPKLTTFSQFEQRVYVRLPVAGSLNEGHGNEGFAVLLTVDTEVLLSGTGLFLPISEDNLSNSLQDQLRARVRLTEHGVSQIGPVGRICCETNSNLTKKEIRYWNSESNCFINKSEKRPSFKCLAGPWMAPENRLRHSRFSNDPICNSIHPFPVFFSKAVILSPGVKYLLSVEMWWELEGEETSRPVTTIWGFQGVPKIQIPEENQGVFRWKQVYRKGLSSSVSSGQFPLLYYII